MNEAEASAIHSACTRLSLDYCYFADQGLMQPFSELFAADGELIVGGQATVGPAAILKSLGGAAEVQTVHAISNVRIDVRGATEAAGTVYVTAYVAPKTDGGATMGQITPMAVGRYEDVYRKTADGWRFARRAFVPMISQKGPEPS
jgi:hypothetical protein